MFIALPPIEQLKVLGQQIEVEVYSEDAANDPVKIAKRSIAYAKEKGHNILSCRYCPGDWSIDEQMMDEIANIKNALNPQETLFVVDAHDRTDAVNTAKKGIYDRLNFEGCPYKNWMEIPWWCCIEHQIGGELNQLNLLVLAKKWKPSTFFTPNEWPTVSWIWGRHCFVVEKAQEQFDEERPKNFRKKCKESVRFQ